MNMLQTWDHTAYAKPSRFWRLAPLMDVPVSKEVLQDPDSALKIFFAGGVASGIAKTTGSPFSRITILLQTQQFAAITTQLNHTSATATISLSSGAASNVASSAASNHAANNATMLRPKSSAIEMAQSIYKSEGWKGFFRGNAIDVARSCIYGGMNYSMFEYFKKQFMPYDPSATGIYSRMIAGGLSGVCSVTVLYPLDLMRTRIAVNSQAKLVQEIRSLFYNEGLRSLYRGMPLSWVQIFPHLAINFATFESVRDYLIGRGYQGMFYSLAAGMVAGTVASISTFPLDVVIRNLQLDGKKNQVYHSAWHCAQIIRQRLGIMGLYAGLMPQLIKSVPVAATNFAIYDFMKKSFALKEEKM